MKERERTQTMTFSAEYLRAQSQRLRALVEKGERMEQLEGKRRRKKEFTDEDIKKEIKELDNIIAECEEMIRKHPPHSPNEIRITSLVNEDCLRTQ